MEEEIQQYKVLNKLKSVYRSARVGDRHESSAEHSWGCLMLADLFLSKMDQKIDRLKVYEMLMYHDIVEIEVGDIPLDPLKPYADKEEVEEEGSKMLAQKIPAVLRDKYRTLFREFEDKKTIEAKFAKAIDGLEAEVHEFWTFDKRQWVGWTAEFLVSKKGHLFTEFPEMRQMFDYIVAYLTKEKFFDHTA